MNLTVKTKKFALQSLTKIYGINRITVKKILGIGKLHPKTSTSNLKNRRLILGPKLKKLRVSYKLKFHVFKRILLLIKNLTYRGIRHLQHLPVRGQRTHTNAGTQRRLHMASKYYPFSIRAKRVYKSKLLKNKPNLQKIRVKIAKNNANKKKKKK